jgi:polysaccharide export outer membrane protein
MHAQHLIRIAAVALLLPLATATPALADGVTVPAGYTIHAGDQLAVSVYGETALSQTVTVLPDGTIEYPMVGRVAIGGQTPANAARTLDRALGKYLRTPIVSIGLVSEGQLTVMVLGNVKTPGKYTLPYNAHITDAIAAAGGMGPTNGDLPVARVSDTDGIRDASLQAILRGGDTSADVTLSNDAVVYVPSPVTFDVEVVGAVDKPGEVPVSAGDRLSTAIAKAGNSVNANADLNDIRVTRQLGDGQTKVFTINLYNELQHGDIASDIVLQKNDVVYVPKARTGGSNVTGSIFSLIGRVFGAY